MNINRYTLLIQDDMENEDKHGFTLLLQGDKHGR